MIIYFRRDIWLIIRSWVGSLAGRVPRDNPEARMGWLVIIGSVPIVVLGLLFQDSIDTIFRQPVADCGDARRFRDHHRHRRPVCPQRPDRWSR